MPDIVRSATLWNPGQAEQIRSKLKSDGYVHGVMRAWEDPSGNLVIVDLMQFDRANGSASFLGWAVDGLYAGAYVQQGSISEANGGKWAEYVFGDHRELRLLDGKGESGVVLRVTSPATANLDLLKGAGDRAVPAPSLGAHPPLRRRISAHVVPETDIEGTTCAELRTGGGQRAT